MNKLTTVVIRIDPSMRDRELWTDSNEYRFPFAETYNGVVSAELTHASVPETEYPVSSRNDAFAYKVGAGDRKVVRLTHGTYTETGLVSALNALLTSEGDGLVAAYDAPSRKITFSHASSSFLIYVADTSSRAVLGITTTDPLASSSTVSPYQYVCGGHVDVRGIKYVVVRSPDIMDRELGYVDMQTDPHQFVPAPERVFKHYKRMSGIRIRIEREDGSLYETGGVNHLLLLKILYIDTAATPPE